MHLRKLQSVSSCCFLRFDSNLGNDLKAKGKESECRKGEICQYFKRVARGTNIMEGVTGYNAAIDWLFYYSIVHMDHNSHS